MFSISRCVLRWGLIGAAGLGTLAFFVGPGPHRGRFRPDPEPRPVPWRMTSSRIPIALRRQLSQLAERVPRTDRGSADRDSPKSTARFELLERDP